MSTDDNVPDQKPSNLGRPGLAAVVAIAVAVLAMAGVGTSIAMHNASSQRHAAGSAPSASPGASPGASAQPGTPRAAPTTIQSPPTVLPLSSPSTAANQPTGSSSGKVVITEFSRDPVIVARGTVIEVNLSSANPHWNQPRAKDPSVLQAMGGSASPDGSAHALFMANGDGTTAVFAAQAPPSCYPKCMIAERAWEITVTVTG
jgi:hypothetical protein